MDRDRAGMPGSLGRTGGPRNRDGRAIRWLIGTIARTHHPRILAPHYSAPRPLVPRAAHGRRRPGRRRASWSALSAWRFGPDWAMWWRQIVPSPLAFLVLYAATWVAALTINGLYRPRARWTIRSEARRGHPRDRGRWRWSRSASCSCSTCRTSAGSCCSSCSRPRPWSRSSTARRPAARARAVPPARSQPAVRARPGRRPAGAGVRRQARGPSRARPPRRSASWTTTVDRHERRWPLLGSLDDLESVLHDADRRRGRDLPPVLAVGPHRRDRRAVRGGGQDRPDPDGRDGPRDLGRARRGARRDPGVLARVRAPTARSRSPPSGSRPAGRGRRASCSCLRSCWSIADRDRRSTAAGPVLFRQTRVGLHGRPFSVVKFRSMVVDAEAQRAELSDRNALNGPVFKVDDDPRITRVGRFLRRTSASTSCRSCGTCSAAR